LNLLRLGLGLTQGWQQHARQDSNDGNDDKEFNKRKPGGAYNILTTFHVPFCLLMPSTWIYVKPAAGWGASAQIRFWKNAFS
jgi:hypothetical protein